MSYQLQICRPSKCQNGLNQAKKAHAEFVETVTNSSQYTCLEPQVRYDKESEAIKYPDP